MTLPFGSELVATFCQPPGISSRANPLFDGATYTEYDSEEWLDFNSAGVLGDVPGNSGVRVTRKTALGYAPFWRAINLIASDMASMPIFVYKRVDDGKERDTKHQSYRLLRRRPNPYMTAYTFIQTLTSHAIYRGNGYAYINFDGGATPKELLPLNPSTTWPVRRNGELWYVTSANGELIKLESWKVIHIKGLGDDGLQGYDLLSYGKQTLNLALNTREHRIRYYKNGARPSVVLECPGRMPPKVLKQLKRNWEALHSGVANHHRTAILQMGTTAKTLTETAKEAQLLEGQEFDVQQISALTGVPPHKIGGKGRQSYASLEQENDSYLSDCLGHWVIALEQEFYEKLLTEKQKDNETHTIEFLTQAKVRVNLLSRYQAYSFGIRDKWLVPNDARRAEGMNPVPWGNDPVDFQKAAGTAGDPGGEGQTGLDEKQVMGLIKQALQEMQAD